MFIENLYEESAASRMLEMIERCAPRMMRAGGGPLVQAYSRDRDTPHRITFEQKKHCVELGRTGQYTGTDISRLTGVSQPSVFKICAKAGIVLPNCNTRENWHKRQPRAKKTP